MTSSDFELADSVIKFTLADLRSRVRTSEMWGVKNAEKLVARTVMSWAKEILGDDDGEHSD